jgi:hypothetical protein
MMRGANVGSCSRQVSRQAPRKTLLGARILRPQAAAAGASVQASSNQIVRNYPELAPLDGEGAAEAPPDAAIWCMGLDLPGPCASQQPTPPAPHAGGYEAAHAFATYANWIVPGRIMLGRYPYVEPSRCSSRELGEEQLTAIIQAGVTTFVSLQVCAHGSPAGLCRACGDSAPCRCCCRGGGAGRGRGGSCLTGR